MMSRVVEEGTGTAAALRGHPGGRQDRHRGGGREPRVHPALVHLLRARREPAHRDRRDRRSAPPGRAARWRRRSPSPCSRPCWAEAADDRGRRQHARRRPLPHPAPHRLGRHGGRVLRRGHPPRPPGGDQGAAPPLRAGPGVRRALPARGQVGRRPQPPQRGRRLRPRRARGHLLHRDGVPRRADAQGDRDRGGAAAAGARDRPRHPDPPGRRLRPPPRRDPPRLQAAQRDRRRRRATRRSRTSASRARAPRR